MGWMRCSPRQLTFWTQKMDPSVGGMTRLPTLAPRPDANHGVGPVLGGIDPQTGQITGINEL